MRIESGQGIQLNTTNLQNSTSLQAPAVKPLGDQIQQALFGRPLPKILDPKDFPDLAVWLKSLKSTLRKLAHLAGDKDEDYQILLAEDAIASIDKDGNIYLGLAFLRAHQNNPEVILGAIAHEVGHRPKRWKHPYFKRKQALTQQALDALCRHEETLADIFAGQALAELGFHYQPLSDFLKAVQIHPHPEYWPAEIREQIIADAYHSRAYRSKNRAKLFPEFNRFSGSKNHLGEY